jgi:hypothetical protein
VAGQVDQQVDLIGADALVQGRIIKAAGLDPLLRRRLKCSSRVPRQPPRLDVRCR